MIPRKQLTPGQTSLSSNDLQSLECSVCTSYTKSLFQEASPSPSIRTGTPCPSQIWEVRLGTVLRDSPACQQPLTGSRPPRWLPAGPAPARPRTPGSRSRGSRGGGRRRARPGCPCTRRTRGSGRGGGGRPAGCKPAAPRHPPCPASLQGNSTGLGRRRGSCEHRPKGAGTAPSLPLGRPIPLSPSAGMGFGATQVPPGKGQGGL